MEKDTLIVSTPYHAPYSTDPIEYDAFIHHQCFRSVYASLVTQYKDGGIHPQIAKSWSVTNNHLEWKFEIQKNLYFENGDPINAEAVLLSLKRQLFMMRKKGSSLPILTNIENIDKLNSPESMISGLYIEDSSIVFRLTKPVPDLLQELSFGLLAIVSELDFDKSTGEWKNPKKINASGVYYIYNWDSNLELKMRSKIPSSWYDSNIFSTVKIYWAGQNYNIANILVGTSEDTAKNNFKFVGPVPNGIAYLHVYSWKKNAWLNSVANRTWLRNSIYEKMYNLGIKPTLSFFPLSIKGVTESKVLIDTKQSDKIPKAFKLTLKNSSLKNKIFNSFVKAFEEVGQLYGFQTSVITLENKLVPQHFDPNNDHIAELGLMGTGILIEAPEHDAKFMFKSKQGIQLPDLDGTINSELDADQIDFSSINNKLFNQAVIWPIGHYSMGIWYDHTINISNLNQAQPPTDYAWISKKL